MVRLINTDRDNEIFAEGNSIEEILDELNADPNGSNEWRYYFRPDADVVDAYYITDGKDDVDGELADVIYDVERG